MVLNHAARGLAACRLGLDFDSLTLTELVAATYLTGDPVVTRIA